MKRRTFLFATALSCAATALAWLRIRQTGDRIRVARRSPAERLARDRARALREAAARARAAGKPLLVLMVPDLTTDEGEDQARQLQELFGAWLNHGGDEALADLLLTEPVCASRFDVACAFGTGRLPGWDPPFLRIDPSSGDVRAPDPDLPAFFGEAGRPWSYITQAEVGAFAAAIGHALHGTPERLLELDVACRAALGSQGVAQIEAGLAAAERLPAELLDRGAAIVRSRARSMPAEAAAALIRQLAGRARTRFVEQPIPGARWARSYGCGFDLEDEEVTALTACGMAWPSPLGERFLYFFNQ